MQNSIYEPPKSDQSQKSGPNGSFLKGVIWGVAIDIGGSTVVGIIYVFFYAVYLASHGVSQDDIARDLAHLDPHSIGGIVTSLIGLMLSFCAGYICAKKSGLVGPNSVYTLCVISSATSLYFGAEYYSTLENILLAIITAGTIYSGGRLWFKKNA